MPTLLKIFLVHHVVWKSQKMSHSTLRAKRATFTYLVYKRSFFGVFSVIFFFFALFWRFFIWLFFAIFYCYSLAIFGNFLAFFRWFFAISFRYFFFRFFQATRSLRSNSVTRQVNFNWTIFGWKCQIWKIQIWHFGWFSNTV